MIYWKIRFDDYDMDGDEHFGWLELDDNLTSTGIFLDDGSVNAMFTEYTTIDSNIAQEDWPLWAKVKNNVV